MGMINRLGGFSFVRELQGRGRHLSGRIYDPVYTEVTAYLVVVL